MNTIVYLRWLDSASTGEWTSVNENGLDEITTIGFLIYEDKKHIQIAHSIDQNNKYCGVLAIPKSVILERRTVET
jgi:hypothetical protein